MHAAGWLGAVCWLRGWRNLDRKSHAVDFAILRCRSRDIDAGYLHPGIVALVAITVSLRPHYELRKNLSPSSGRWSDTASVVGQRTPDGGFLFSFEKGATGALHSHPHLQSTYVESGQFTFTIDGEEFDVGPGDSFIIPASATHGCVCREPGRLIDTFTPRRTDFL